MLLLLLGCLLPTTLGKRCLHCWPELSALMDYDLQILWGTPGPPAELSQSIHNMFLNKHVSLQLWYLGQDQLEEEAAKLFIHIDEAIKKLRDDKQLLMDEIQIQKQLFAEKLSERAEELKEKACNHSCDFWTMEVMNCANCKIHYLTCQDPTLCPVKHKWNIIWAIVFSIVLLLVSIAGGGFFLWWIEKRKKAEKVYKVPSGLSCHSSLADPFSTLGRAEPRPAQPPNTAPLPWAPRQAQQQEQVWKAMLISLQGQSRLSSPQLSESSFSSMFR